MRHQSWWNEYVTVAVNRNLSNCENSPKKRFSGLQRDSNPWPLRWRCSALPAELWRPIHWRLANLLSSSTRERNGTLNEMIWTAGIQMKWVCDHRSESQFKQLRKYGHILISFVFPQFKSFHSSSILQPRSNSCIQMHKNVECNKSVNVVYSRCALSYPASSQAHHSNNLKQIMQIKHNRLRIPTGRRQTSWLFTKHGGGGFGTTENKSS